MGLLGFSLFRIRRAQISRFGVLEFNLFRVRRVETLGLRVGSVLFLELGVLRFSGLAF